MSDTLTIRKVLDFIHKNEYDLDEYFSASCYIVNSSMEHGGPGGSLDDPLYSDQTKWIAVFYVVGSSEGWYVHVDRVIIPPEDAKIGDYYHQIVLVGKFWERERAEQAVTAITKYINCY